MANNVNIATKSTGQQHTAAELNLQVGWMNSPLQAPQNFSTSYTLDGNHELNDYSVSGNETWNITGTKGCGFVMDLVITNTPTITKGTGWYKDLHGFFGTELSPGTYRVYGFATSKGVDISVPDLVIAPDLIAPTVLSAVVQNAYPTQLVVTFSEIVTIGALTDLSLNGDWSAITITGVSGGGTNALTFTLDTSIANGESGSFVYGTSNTIKDTSNNALVASSTAVTNNVSASYSILVQDDFADSSIDPTKWGSVHSTVSETGGQLVQDASGESLNATSFLGIKSVLGYINSTIPGSGILVANIRMNWSAGVTTANAIYCGFCQDGNASNYRSQCGPGAIDANKLRMLFVDAGVAEGVVESIYNKNARIKIVYNHNTTTASWYVYSAGWQLVTSTTITLLHATNPLKFQIWGANSLSADTIGYFDDFYLTDGDYSTETP